LAPRIRHDTNYWTELEVPMIPLGYQTTGTLEDGKRVSELYLDDEGRQKIVKARLPEARTKRGRRVGVSNTVLIIGKTGGGKSVQRKVYEYMVHFRRPIIDLDWNGDDSYWCAFPNSEPENLPPMTPPGGIEGDYLFYPVVQNRASGLTKRTRKSFERIVMPYIGKYSEQQLQVLGFSPGAAMYFVNVLLRYGPFEDWDSLSEFIENFPTPRTAGRIMSLQDRGKWQLRHKKRYLPNDTMNDQSKESIKKVLPDLIAKGVFALDKKREYDFTKAFTGYTEKQLLKFKEDGIEPAWHPTNMFFSFLDKQVARVEIYHFFEVIERLRRWFPESPRFLILIEEAHKMFKEEGQKEEKVQEAIEDFVLICRKLGVMLALVMPTVNPKVLSDMVLGDVKEVIAGRLGRADAWRIAREFTKNSQAAAVLATVLMSLEYERYQRLEDGAWLPGRREFCYISSDKGFWWTYRPFNAPCEIHREVVDT